MLDTFATILQILGLVLLVLGYRKNNRNVLLSAALCFIFSIGLGEFVHGFVDGYNRR